MSLFRNKAELEVKGLNQNKLLMLLQKLEIEVFDLHKVSFDCLYFTIFSSNLKKLLENTRGSCYNIAIKRRYGGLWTIMNSLSRIGIAIGFFVSVILACFLSGYVWEIRYDINGDSAKIEEEANTVLSNNEIVVGTKKSQINVRELEKILQAKIESAAVVVVKLSGTALEISIKEAVIKSTSQTESDNLLSLYDGIVDKIELASGIAKIDIGSSVYKGQTLVDAAEIGDIFAKAQAKIYGKIFVSADASGTINQMNLIRSGNCQTSNAIRLYGIKIGKNVTDYEFYESEIVENYVSKDFILPVIFQKTINYELIKSEQTITESELIEKLKIEALERAKQMLSSEMQIINTYYSQNSENGFTRVVCTIETYGILGEK